MMHIKTDILAFLRQPGREGLRQCFQTRHYPKKVEIFPPNHDEDLIFIVSEGRARLFLAYEDKEFALAILERGDVYSTHTRAHVAALEDTTLLCAPTRQVRDHMLRLPEFTGTMVRVLGEVLRHSIGIIDDLAFRDVQMRLARFLRFVAGQSGGVPPGGGALLTLGLTNEQLASLLGTTRQTLSTMLNNMERAGLLELRSRGTIFIPNLDALDAAPG